MLIETLHFPAVYENLPSDPSHYCALLIAILHDATRNCVLLTDDANEISGAIDAAVNSWPAKYQKRIDDLLANLAERFVPVTVPRMASTIGCGKATCSLSHSFVGRHVHMYLVPDNCVHCDALTNHVAVGDYTISSFGCYIRAKAEHYRVRGNRWTKVDFAERIWQPIFRHAKRIELVDRYIGRAAQRNHGHVPDTYKATLEWMLSEADSVSEKGIEKIVIYTGCQTPDDALASTIRDNWQVELTRIGATLSKPPMIRFNVIREKKGQEMPHQRYLFTDQIGIALDRGFDLLLTNAPQTMIRDVDIHLVDEPEERGSITSLLKKMRRVPDRN